MLYKSATAVLAALGSAAIAFAPAAGAQPVEKGGHHAAAAISAHPALKSRTVALPGGVSVTFGFSSLDGHAVPPLNGAATTRQVYLDDTAFAKITGKGVKAELSVGYQAACTVDVNPALVLNAGVGLEGEAYGGVEAAPSDVSPVIEGYAGPLAQAGIGGQLTVTPGSGKTEEVDTGPVPPGKLVPFVDRDVSLEADGCGGSLTVRPFVTIVVDAPAEHYHDTVYADPFTV